MVEIITEFGIRLPERLEGVSEASFFRYINWEEDKKELNKRIIKKFEEGLFGKLGYSDYDRPDTKKEEEIQIGNIRFNLVTVPTTKRPAYKEVVEEFDRYLNFLNEDKQQKITRKGVRTINQSSYIILEDLENKIDKSLKEIREGREGISQSVSNIEADEKVLKLTPENISIVFNWNYKALTDHNSRVYIFTKNMIKEGNNRVGKFDKLLLEDSLKMLECEGIPKELVVLSYPYENVTLTHHIQPISTPKYKDIIDSLIKPAPEDIKRINVRSKIGDFAKLRMINTSMEEILRGKGLIDDTFLEEYKPAMQENGLYVKLQGVINRLNSYKNSCVTPSIKQNILTRVKIK